MLKHLHRFRENSITYILCFEFECILCFFFLDNRQTFPWDFFLTCYGPSIRTKEQGTASIKIPHAIAAKCFNSSEYYLNINTSQKVNIIYRNIKHQFSVKGNKSVYSLPYCRDTALGRGSEIQTACSFFWQDPWRQRTPEDFFFKQTPK